MKMFWAFQLNFDVDIWHFLVWQLFWLLVKNWAIFSQSFSHPVLFSMKQLGTDDKIDQIKCFNNC
jgi:hypothetical protein